MGFTIRLLILYLGLFSAFKQGLRVKMSIDLNQPRDQAGPPGLVTGAESRAVVAMEVFVEEDVIMPMRIRLKFLHAAVHGTAAVLVRQKILDRRLASSRLTSNRFISLPEPVGHSI